MIGRVALVAAAVAATVAAAPGAGRASSPFTFSSERLTPALRHEMRGVSWHEGCPVGLDGLRRLRIAHWGFDGRPRTGEMVVAATVVRRVRTAFATLYRRHFPIRRMHLVDRYGASDYASIEADNTSAFNCRRVTGGRAWSEHAYGRAIDVNPIENPYVYADGTTTHRASRPYLDRSPYRPGMAVRGGVLVGAFRGAGWSWGGDWSPPKDLQHFSTTGR